MYKFFDYINQSEMQAHRKLKIISDLLKSQQIKNKLFNSDQEPHIFVFSTNPDTYFQGVRVYPIANSVAFKVQNKINTHPYGKPYLLDFEKMYNNLMGQKDASEEDCAKSIIDYICTELKKFFTMSAKYQYEKNPENIKLMVRSQGTDYSTKLFGGASGDYSSKVYNGY
jgi:hypothetical protein